MKIRLSCLKRWLLSRPRQKRQTHHTLYQAHVLLLPIVKPVTATSSIAWLLVSIPLVWDLGTPTPQDASGAKERRKSVDLVDPPTSLVLWLLSGDIFSNMLYAKSPQHPACNPMRSYLVCGHLIGLSSPILSCKMKGRLETSLHL